MLLPDSLNLRVFSGIQEGLGSALALGLYSALKWGCLSKKPPLFRQSQLLFAFLSLIFIWQSLLVIATFIIGCLAIVIVKAILVLPVF
jgi:uncharacterized membrane protein